MRHSCLIFLSLCLPLMGQHPGKQPYQLNCAACHIADASVVGPSLVAIAKTYPKEKKAEFIQWAKAPGKKNPKMIQMPSMAHVPDADLAHIHAYILEEAKGKTEKKRKELFPPFKEPKRELPYVVRASMPNSSPASIAIVLPNGLTASWDTERCRLRYLYEGSRSNLFNMWSPAKLENQPFYLETGSSLFSSTQKPHFLGYRLVNKYPEFHYRIGEMQVRELILSTEKGVARTFTINGHTGPITLDLSSEGKASLTSEKGSLKNGTLTLSEAEAQSFTLTTTRP